MERDYESDFDGPEPDDERDDGPDEGDFYETEAESIRREFAFPGGNSALRAASPSNPRCHPCPTCEEPNLLTPADVARGYQCDACADRDERGGY